jgi:uncharacterized membrane protein (UPF0127 family)
MLFLFDGRAHFSPFCNAETHAPLDVAFLSHLGRVREVRDLPSIEETGGVVSWLRPSSSYANALEVPRGWLARHGVHVGSILVIRIPFASARARAG